MDELFELKDAVQEFIQKIEASHGDLRVFPASRLQCTTLLDPLELAQTTTPTPEASYAASIITSLHRQLSSAQSRILALQTQLAKKDADVAKKYNSKEILNYENKLLENEITVLRKKLQHPFADEIKRLGDQIDAFEVERRKVARKKVSYDELHDEVNYLEKKVEEFKKEREELERMIKDRTTTAPPPKKRTPSPPRSPSPVSFFQPNASSSPARSRRQETPATPPRKVIPDEDEPTVTIHKKTYTEAAVQTLNVQTSEIGVEANLVSAPIQVILPIKQEPVSFSLPPEPLPKSPSPPPPPPKDEEEHEPPLPPPDPSPSPSPSDNGEKSMEIATTPLLTQPTLLVISPSVFSSSAGSSLPPFSSEPPLTSSSSFPNSFKTEFPTETEREASEARATDGAGLDRSRSVPQGPVEQEAGVEKEEDPRFSSFGDLLLADEPTIRASTPLNGLGVGPVTGMDSGTGTAEVDEPHSPPGSPPSRSSHSRQQEEVNVDESQRGFESRSPLGSPPPLRSSQSRSSQQALTSGWSFSSHSREPEEISFVPTEHEHEGGEDDSRELQFDGEQQGSLRVFSPPDSPPSRLSQSRPSQQAVVTGWSHPHPSHSRLQQQEPGEISFVPTEIDQSQLELAEQLRSRSTLSSHTSPPPSTHSRSSRPSYSHSSHGGGSSQREIVTGWSRSSHSREGEVGEVGGDESRLGGGEEEEDDSRELEFNDSFQGPPRSSQSRSFSQRALATVWSRSSQSHSHSHSHSEQQEEEEEQEQEDISFVPTEIDQSQLDLVDQLRSRSTLSGESSLPPPPPSFSTRSTQSRSRSSRPSYSNGDGGSSQREIDTGWSRSSHSQEPQDEHGEGEGDVSYVPTEVDESQIPDHDSQPHSHHHDHNGHHQNDHSSHPTPDSSRSLTYPFNLNPYPIYPGDTSSMFMSMELDLGPGVMGLGGQGHHALFGFLDGHGEVSGEGESRIEEEGEHGQEGQEMEEGESRLEEGESQFEEGQSRLEEEGESRLEEGESRLEEEGESQLEDEGESRLEEGESRLTDIMEVTEEPTSLPSLPSIPSFHSSWSSSYSRRGDHNHSRDILREEEEGEEGEEGDSHLLEEMEHDQDQGEAEEEESPRIPMGDLSRITEEDLSLSHPSPSNSHSHSHSPSHSPSHSEEQQPRTRIDSVPLEDMMLGDGEGEGDVSGLNLVDVSFSFGESDGDEEDKHEGEREHEHSVEGGDGGEEERLGEREPEPVAEAETEAETETPPPTVPVVSVGERVIRPLPRRGR